MMVGEEYKASLFDGRATYFEGERIEDLPGHPRLGITEANGGGLYAQRIVTRRHYDLDAAKERALQVAGLGNGAVH
jgi:hypothetical protein